jgi:hypothetical protein
MNINKYKLRIEFLTEVLGTQPQKDVATEFITSKVADENGNLPDDELATLPEELEKGTTAFHKLDGHPIFYDYQIKGFLKEAAQIFNGLRGVKNLKSKMDNLVFVTPRQIQLHLPEGGESTFCERPLRAMTAQGPRTSLARSEQLPVGTWFECFLEVYDGPISEALLRDLLSYGERKGLGQWRNGGKGRVSFELQEVSF